MSPIELANAKRYLKAPTVEEIDLVLKHLGVTATQFERFFNVYENCIAQLHMGARANVTGRYGQTYERKLPRKYWHLIFENLPNKSHSYLKPVAQTKPKIKRAKKMKKVKMDEKILALI